MRPAFGNDATEADKNALGVSLLILPLTMAQQLLRLYVQDITISDYNLLTLHQSQLCIALRILSDI